MESKKMNNEQFDYNKNNSETWRIVAQLTKTANKPKVTTRDLLNSLNIGFMD